MDTEETQQPSLYSATIATYLLASIAVSLRFWSRRLKGAGWWLDDWLVLVALFFATGCAVNLLIWIRDGGLGLHATEYSTSVLPKYLFAQAFFYTFNIAFVKYAILALYFRIFQRTNIKPYLVTVAVIVTLWAIAVCFPISLIWDKTVQGACNVDQRKWFIGISVPNTVTDVVLLILPFPYIRQLQTKAKKKVLLGGLFLLGGVVTVASVMRLVSLINEEETDLTWNITTLSIWSEVESNFAIISACLPCLRPVWTVIRTGSVESRSRPSRTFRETISSGKPSAGQTPKGRSNRSSPGDTDSTHAFVALEDNPVGSSRGRDFSTFGAARGQNASPRLEPSASTQASRSRALDA